MLPSRATLCKYKDPKCRTRSFPEWAQSPKLRTRSVSGIRIVESVAPSASGSGGIAGLCQGTPETLHSRSCVEVHVRSRAEPRSAFPAGAWELRRQSASGLLQATLAPNIPTYDYLEDPQGGFKQKSVVFLFTCDSTEK